VNARFLLPLLALIALLACSRPVEQPPAPHQEPEPIGPPAADIAAESENLLNIARGATVVARTAELTLKGSAAQAIDGDPESGWISPPADTRQSLVFALPARTRIEEIGVQTSPFPHMELKSALFEVSRDGSRFTRLYEAKFAAQQPPQLLAVDPTEARYIRVTTTDAPGRFARLNGVHIRGTLLDKPVRGSITGCWTINGFDARFSADENRVIGRIAEHGLVALSGGTEGMLYRLAWSRGGETGVAAIAVSDDGRHLTGLQWYERPQTKTFATSWFGERKECGPQVSLTPQVVSAFARKPAPFPLYSRTPEPVLAMLALTPGKRLRLVAHEYRQPSPQENRRRAQEELDALRAVLQKHGADLSRLEFVASGSDQKRILMTSDVKRALNSVVEIESP
jgi:hypothetical protein